MVVEVVKGKVSGGGKSLSGEFGRPLLKGCLLLAAKVAVLRWRVLGGRMGRWEWWSGVIEAVVLAIRSRPGVASAGVCIPGSLLPPTATRTRRPSCLPCAGSAALRPTEIRPITRVQITSYHSVHGELHYTTLLSTSF